MRGIASRRTRSAMAVLAVVGSMGLAPTLRAPAAALPATSTPVAGAHGVPGVEQRLIVAFEEDATDLERDRLHRLAGATAVSEARSIGAEVVAVADPAMAARAYERSAKVRYAEPDGVVRALAAPSDGEYGRQWNLHPAGPANPASSNWEAVWASRARLGDGVKVAVVDSGYRPGGADAPKHVNTSQGRDLVDGDATPDDENGHGTHVIGTIAQQTDNPFGVAGVAPEAEIVPIKVLDHSGAGAISTAIRGLQHAVAIGAHVINLSLGGPYSRAFCDAVATASQSAVVVAASGNESSAAGMAPVSWPASCPGALAVGGLRQDGTRAHYSNGGCALALTAPGGDTDDSAGSGSPLAILQETFDVDGRFGLFYDAGTSMAAAHVSGAAAVALSQQPRPSVDDVRRALVSAARDLGRAGPDPATGAGALDVRRTLDALAAGPVASPRSSPGYWLVASDGGIFAFGDAAFHGSTGNIRLNKPIVGMAATPTGAGYWLVASDGGIFAFGDAAFHGSTGSVRLDAPIVAIRPTSSGGGYWLVGSDGGIFAFGDAPYKGSTGGSPLNRPITGMAVSPTGHGYWLTASDGGIFAFGDAAFHGSTGALTLNSPIVGMAPTCRGTGYWLVAADGGMFSFGSARFLGSTGGLPLSRPVVGMARAVDVG